MFDTDWKRSIVARIPSGRNSEGDGFLDELELPLMSIGCWSYLSPDYFPLQPLLGADFGISGAAGSAWAGLNYVTAPCYFAVTTDAIALGRWFAAVGLPDDDDDI